MAGLTAALLAFLAAAASAQSPMPYSGEPPAASTAPAVSTAAAVAASTETAVAVSTEAAKPAKPKLAKPIRAVIHAEAKDWEPISLRAAGDPEKAKTEAVLLLEKVKGKYKGAPSKAKAFARLRAVKDASWLVISVFPKALERRRAHFEVRLRLVEGFVEDAKASLVSVVDRRYTGAGMDSDELRARGVEFEEDSPASGRVEVSALDPRPSKKALNAGVLRQAAFAAKDVRLCDVSWSVTGLPARR